jgi:hypothetical protein
MARQRRFLAAMATLALACALLQAVTGDVRLVLHLTPLFLIGGLLLAGRYVGEERIVARWRAALTRRPPRPVRVRWQPRAERALASLLERSPRLLRGPPAVVAAA